MKVLRESSTQTEKINFRDTKEELRAWVARAVADPCAEYPRGASRGSRVFFLLVGGRGGREQGNGGCGWLTCLPLKDS